MTTNVRATLLEKRLAEEGGPVSKWAHQSRVAARFSRAAEGYDAAASLQRQVADHLLEVLPTSCQPAALMDVGCGTGYLISHLARRFDATAVGLDLAAGMLAHAGRQHARLPIHWIQADAERLPLAANRMDLIVSSLALQWCPSLERFLDEARRVLRPGGWLAFTTLCEGSLDELRTAWLAVDKARHVNDFLPEAQLRERVCRKGWRTLRCEFETRTTWHDVPRDVLRALKQIGANTVASRSDECGLSGRRRIAALEAALSARREPAGIPTRYRVATILMQRHDETE